MHKKVQHYFLLILLLLASQAQALVLGLPSSLSPELLSETVPTAIAPFDLEEADYRVEWIGTPIPGVKVELIPGALQWVRVMDVLILPRGRLRVEASQSAAGRISHAGFHQPMELMPEGSVRSEIPVALISGPRNPVQIVLKRDGKEVAGSVMFKFAPRKRLHERQALNLTQKVGGPHVYFDANCSRFGMTAQAKFLKARTQEDQNAGLDDEWLYVGCRLTESYRTNYRTAGVEVLVFWDNAEGDLDIGGIQTPAATPALWPLRLRPDLKDLTLRSRDNEVRIGYRAPEKYNFGSLGVGIGPYSYGYYEPSSQLNTQAPIITIYGSYFITESMRLVAFNATAIHSRYFTDFGMYLNSEYIRTLDKRLAINIMLGGHVIGFNTMAGGKYFLGFPQGFEMIFSDFFLKAHNLSAGAFIYPMINGVSYNNMWLRWGTASLFAEFNFISWSQMVGEKPNEDQYYSRSFGITLGMPLWRFL